MRASPNFPSAVCAYTEGLARFREAPRLVNKMISYEKRFRVLGYLLYLQADKELFGPNGGATYARLLDLCIRRNEVSPRVLKTTLAMLRLARFIDTIKDPSNARSKYYRPTANMQAFIQSWLGYAVGALDALQPSGQRTEAMRTDPSFADRFFVSGGRDHVSGIPPADHMPEFISYFGSREGAAAVVLAVMIAKFQGTPVPSRSQVAKRFGLSKTQVSTVIAEGAEIGFLTVDLSGIPAPTDHLHESYAKWISIELAFYARHMQPLA